MANKELLYVIDQIGRERGIDRDALIEAIEAAIVSALRKRYGPGDNLRANLDPQTGEICVFSLRRVVEEIVDSATEISLAEARRISPGASVGETIQVPLDASEFSRIAAQTAKQIIVQRVRDAERQMLYDEYKGREGEIVNGIVTRKEGGVVFVDIGRAEGILPRREQSFRENFQRGDRVRVYVLEVKKTPKGTQIILSRTHPNLLIKLFEMEVPEIAEGIVQIKAAARDPCGRSKIAVVSVDKNVDPVGACVGVRGSRVQAVVQEMRGEKIDIVEWSPDPKTFLVNGLSPAKISRVYADEEAKAVEVVVPDDQLSLAIGKRGQNVRLAAKLLHWKVDIFSESEYAERETKRAKVSEASTGGVKETTVSGDQKVAGDAGEGEAEEPKAKGSEGEDVVESEA